MIDLMNLFQVGETDQQTNKLESLKDQLTLKRDKNMSPTSIFDPEGKNMGTTH